MLGLITANEFVEEALDDYHSPTTSTFVEKMPSCRQTVSYLEQSLDFDREGLIKMKKAIKAIHNNGLEQVDSEQSLSKSLEKLGANAMSKDSEPDIGAAFIKFSIVTKELSSLMKALMQNLNNIVLYPLDSILKGELKGVKRKEPFERAWREYEAKILKIEKEKKQLAKEAGLIRTEISSAEIAEEMDKERKGFQLQMCEYLLKVNDIKTKKGVELLQHFVEYYHSQQRYFQDGLDHLKHFNTYIDELSNKLACIKSNQDEERKQLMEIKNLLNNGENGLNANTSNLSNVSGNTSSNISSNGNNLESSSKKEKNVYNLHQLQGNKHYGYCKSGYLLKKSEGKMKMKVWQKRKCEISGFDLESNNSSSFLSIYHSDENKSPVKINLLTCQVKQIPDDKCSFDLISYSRTYHFQAENELDAEGWVSVILNCKEAILKKEFDNNKSIKNEITSTEDYLLTQTLNELRTNIIASIRKLPGNQNCVDCNSSKDITWVSTNFGCLTCIECSGVHRELGVHVSRIHSLTLDNIGISLLLLAKNMSNERFNSVYEANLEVSEKIDSKSTMEERCLFIKSKYLKRKFVKSLSAGDDAVLKTNLEHAILNKSISQLLQCFGENNQCLNWILPRLEDSNERSLHLAISQEDNTSLHLIDFLIQNNQNINNQNSDGNTALHLCVIQNKSEPLKLLLRSSANINIINKNGKTPIQIAKELNRTHLVELLEQSIKNKKSLMFENLKIDWNLQSEENSTDFSDEDFNEEKMSAKEYFDWLLNSRNSKSDLHMKRSHADTNSITSNDTLIYKNNLENQSRSSSVLGQFYSIQSKSTVTNKSSKTEEVPPLPPHKNAIKHALSLSNNNNQNVANNNLTKKEQFLKDHRTSMHSRTISDLGLQLASINSFTSTNQTSQKNLNARRRTYLENCNQLGLDGHSHTPLSLKRPALPPPLAPINHQNNYHSNSQTNLISSNHQFINKSNIANSKSDNKIVRRKQTIYVENRHLSNGQSFESLPSSDDLNNSNNSNPHCCPNQVGQIITNHHHSYNVPIPPPRRGHMIPSRREKSKLKTCRALFDCSKDADDELQFKKNEIIEILKEETSDPEWLLGRIGDREGVFPISFVQMLN